MKNIIITLASFIIIFSTTSCNDWLTLKPESELVLEDYWQDETHVNQILAGCYRSMLHGNGDITKNGEKPNYMDCVLTWGELRSDNVVYGQDMPTPMAQMAQWDITTGNRFTNWQSIYVTINYCNTLLYYAPDVVGLDENFTESELKTVQAEALAIRALSYFYLVRTFKEVPWKDEPSLDDTQDYAIAKSTEDEVLDNITADLLVALASAREKFDIEEYNKGRVTKNMIRALLADIALWRNDFTSCVSYCDQIIDTKSLELVEAEDMLQEVFYSGNSTESIFELQFDKDDNASTSVNNFYQYKTTSGFYAFPLTLLTGNKSLFDYKLGAIQESEYDIRKKDFLYDETNLEASDYAVFKYAGWRLETYNSTTGVISSTYRIREKAANWIVYRYSDVLLMKAEALVQLNELNGAMQLVNQVYLRSNLDENFLPVDSLQLEDYTSVSAMESLVLRERQRELMFEGKRWYDLMRLARRNQSTSDILIYIAQKDQNFSGAKYKTMNSLYLPIHSDIMNANSALVQNPFYQIDDDGTITK